MIRAAPFPRLLPRRWQGLGQPGRKSRVYMANQRSWRPGFENTNLFSTNIGLSYFRAAGIPWGSLGCEFKMGTRGLKPQLGIGAAALPHNLG